jgi:hypothetical protein
LFVATEVVIPELANARIFGSAPASASSSFRKTGSDFAETLKRKFEEPFRVLIDTLVKNKNVMFRLIFIMHLQIPFPAVTFTGTTASMIEIDIFMYNYKRTLLKEHLALNESIDSLLPWEEIYGKFQNFM